MTSKQLFYSLCAALALLVVAIGGSAYIANGLLTKQAKKLHDIKLQLAVYDAEQTSLTKAKKDVARYKPLGNIAQTIVPQDKDQAEAVREIVNLAAASGISPSAIAFPTSTLGSGTGTVGGSATGVAAPVVNASPLSQLTPVKGIAGVYNLQITVQQDSKNPVSYSSFLDFLSRLEQNRRTAAVSAIQLQPDSKDPSLLSFTLTLNEFIKP